MKSLKESYKSILLESMSNSDHDNMEKAARDIHNAWMSRKPINLLEFDDRTDSLPFGQGKAPPILGKDSNPIKSNVLPVSNNNTDQKPALTGIDLAINQNEQEVLSGRMTRSAADSANKNYKQQIADRNRRDSTDSLINTAGKAAHHTASGIATVLSVTPAAPIGVGINAALAINANNQISNNGKNSDDEHWTDARNTAAVSTISGGFTNSLIKKGLSRVVGTLATNSPISGAVAGGVTALTKTDPNDGLLSASGKVGIDMLKGARTSNPGLVIAQHIGKTSIKNVIENIIRCNEKHKMNLKEYYKSILLEVLKPHPMDGHMKDVMERSTPRMETGKSCCWIGSSTFL